MNLDAMYPTPLYAVVQVVLLILGILPGIIFGLWRWAATK